MLSLSANLEKDIERNNSTLYPLIIIDNEFFISTIEESISINDLQTAFKDYGLSISNVKESININTNKFRYRLYCWLNFHRNNESVKW